MCIFSNAWPPLQEIVVKGLLNSGDKSANSVALHVVKKWVKSNYIAFLQTNGSMFEKYDAEKVKVYTNVNIIQSCTQQCVVHTHTNVKV